ncbi:NAD(P)-binding Rossmann-like domain protein [Mycobacterium xenopi 3993]|nr:NAD(P)-binding Rossmann-like domain protein [Mycobacterium xenopi 3993]
MTTPDCEQPTRTPDDIDIDALREKYRQEREKRLRPEGSKQYLELTGELAKFYEIDPYSPPVVRDPISEDIYVAVLGGGIAGLLAGAYLKKAGVDDVHVIEMGGDFGASGIGTGSPASNATTTRTATCRCWKNWITSRPRSTPTAPRSGSIVSASESISASTTRQFFPPRSVRFAGTKRSNAGGSAPTAATTSEPVSSS